MSRKFMKIAFTHGGIIPASVLKSSKDQSVAPAEPVKVPEAYGLQLISDKHAYDYEEWEKEQKASEAAAKKRATATKDDASKDSRIAELETLNKDLISDLGSEREKLAGLEKQNRDLTAELEAEREMLAGLEKQLSDLQSLYDAKNSETASDQSADTSGEAE